MENSEEIAPKRKSEKDKVESRDQKRSYVQTFRRFRFLGKY